MLNKIQMLPTCIIYTYHILHPVIVIINMRNSKNYFLLRPSLLHESFGNGIVFDQIKTWRQSNLVHIQASTERTCQLQFSLKRWTASSKSQTICIGNVKKREPENERQCQHCCNSNRDMQSKVCCCFFWIAFWVGFVLWSWYRKHRTWSVSLSLHEIFLKRFIWKSFYFEKHYTLYIKTYISENMLFLLVN